MVRRHDAARFVLAVLLCGSAFAVAAAAADLQARVDRTTAAPGDQVVLTVTLSGRGRDLAMPELPPIAGVDAARGGTSSSFQMVNGAVSSSQTWTWVLSIRSGSDVRIPALQTVVDGQTLRTQPITITVTGDPGTVTGNGNRSAPPRAEPAAPAARPGRAGPGSPYFVTLEVDRDEVYVGEQVVLVFRFFADPYARLFDRPQYEAPRTEGFWREDLPPQRNSRETVGGKIYDMTELRYALYPTRSGRLTVAPARVTLSGDPFADLFGSRRNRGSGPQTLESPSLTVEVLDLPRPAPPGFLGLVSRQVELDVQTDRTSVPRGDPVTWTLVLKADGSLKSVTEVPWEAPRGVQVHEAGGGLEMKEARGRQLAVLRSEKVIVPGSEGRVELPAARVTWFDPGQKRYRTIEAGARTLEVTPSDNPVDEGGVQRATGFRGEIERLASDLAFVHPAPARLDARGAPLPETFGWWLVSLLAPLSLGGWRLWLGRRRALLGDPVGLRRRHAARTARRQLDEAAAAADAEAASALVIRAVTGYVADMTGRAASGLPAGAVGAHADALGLPEVGTALESLLQECAAASSTRPAASRSSPSQSLPDWASGARSTHSLASCSASSLRPSRWRSPMNDSKRLSRIVPKCGCGVRRWMAIASAYSRPASSSLPLSSQALPSVKWWKGLASMRCSRNVARSLRAATASSAATAGPIMPCTQRRPRTAVHSASAPAPAGIVSRAATGSRKRALTKKSRIETA